MHYQCCVRS